MAWLDDSTRIYTGKRSNVPENSRFFSIKRLLKWYHIWHLPKKLDSLEKKIHHANLEDLSDTTFVISLLRELMHTKKLLANTAFQRFLVRNEQLKKSLIEKSLQSVTDYLPERPNKLGGNSHQYMLTKFKAKKAIEAGPLAQRVYWCSDDANSYRAPVFSHATKCQDSILQEEQNTFTPLAPSA